MNHRRIVMVTPFHTDYYTAYADSFEKSELLRLALQWKFRGYRCVPKERNRLIPPIGALVVAAAKWKAGDFAQSVRFSMLPIFDRWASSHICDGDHVFSSYAYANRCFKICRRLGGKTFLDGGNSHPVHSWKILTEEFRKWGINETPVPANYHKRAVGMMEDVDYVLAPSRFVANSFLEQGFRKDQILNVFYPVNLSVFTPNNESRRKNKPFTVVNTGGLSLRKGTPYLLEALRILHKRIPNMKILLSNLPSESIRPILAKYNDLPIEWSDYLPPDKLANRLKSADLFILPSLEEGLVRTALQAMACGLPVVLSTNTGANDYIMDGVNGSEVPICDVNSIVNTVEFWWEKIRQGYRVPHDDLHERLSHNNFYNTVNSIFSGLKI